MIYLFVCCLFIKHVWRIIVFLSLGYVPSHSCDECPSAEVDVTELEPEFHNLRDANNAPIRSLIFNKGL